MCRAGRRSYSAWADPGVNDKGAGGKASDDLQLEDSITGAHQDRTDTAFDANVGVGTVRPQVATNSVATRLLD